MQRHGELLDVVMQASSAYSLKVQGWLREEALEWGSKIDADIAAKEKDTETIKQERQRDLMKLKVCSGHYICIARDVPESLVETLHAANCQSCREKRGKASHLEKLGAICTSHKCHRC